VTVPWWAAALALGAGLVAMGLFYELVEMPAERMARRWMRERGER
jgi:hypothetical protein